MGQVTATGCAAGTLIAALLGCGGDAVIAAAAGLDVLAGLDGRILAAHARLDEQSFHTGAAS